MAGIHRERPGADALEAATGDPAISLGDDIWMSPGVSNSYAVRTDAGRVIVNAGLVFEGALRQKAIAEEAGPTRAIIVSQGHADHWGAVNALREDGTDVVMHSNYRFWRNDHELLAGYRAPKTTFAFEKFSIAIMEHLKSIDPATIDFSFPEPTVTVDRRLELQYGGRRFELAWTPGGETTDSLVVWLPGERICFSGNTFGPLFAHLPNLVTIRGDRYRDALSVIDSIETVRALGAEVLVTGHFDPIVGADLIDSELGRLRDAVQYLHDETVAGMNAGTDVHTLMRTIRLPEHLDIGEGYGKASWDVRAIWENYAGWFHHRSTTELYGVPAEAVSPDLVDLAGADAIVSRAAERLAGGEVLEAIHLAELVGRDHAAARDVLREAHQQLLAASTNFWETSWLSRQIEELS
jgi:alkyl sulfatase BDS1-like metallo-beta-lactamase superfamily hydrolase